MEKVILFFNSNFFVALTAFIVGGVAIYLYKKQKIDYKQDAASIILMEIRHAEKIIDQLKGSIPTTFDTLLLPTNNWSANNHLFIKNLDRDELDLVNNFYNQCMLIDKSMSQLTISLQLEQKSNYVHKTLCDLAKGAISKADYDNKRNNFLNLIEKDPYAFSPRAPKEKILIALNSLTNITTSTAGNKLKNIARID